MKSFFRLAILTIIILMIAGRINAQQWSDEQKEVWTSVEAYWEAASKGDVAGFLSYFDESFVGWANQSDAPQNKASRSKLIEYGLKNSKSLVYTITPASIWVKDDFAFVHYYYTDLSEDADGKKTGEAGRWTDILIKDGNKWIMVGDHGGPNPNDD